MEQKWYFFQKLMTILVRFPLLNWKFNQNLGSSLSETFNQAECVEKGDLMLKLCNIAAENRVWLSLGGAHEKLEELENNTDRQKIGNAHILIDDGGTIKQVYKTFLQIFSTLARNIEKFIYLTRPWSA